MSRVHYNDDEPNIFWGGWAKKAMGGKRGQAALAEIEQALLAMPRKRLITDHWAAQGDVCLLGGLDAYRRSQQTGLPLYQVIESMQPDPPTFTRDESGEYPLFALFGYDRVVTVPTYSRIFWKQPRMTIYHFDLLPLQEHMAIQDELRAAEYWLDDDDELDPRDAAEMLNLSWVFAWTAIEHNDELWGGLTPEQRWERALDWVRRCQASPEKAYWY